MDKRKMECRGIFLLFLALSISAEPDEIDDYKAKTDKCPEIAKKSKHFLAAFRNTCYVFYDIEKYWDEARDHCWWRGGEMVTIRDEDTMNFLKRVLNSDHLGWDKNGVWIGASDRAKEGKWYWTTGEPVEWGFWASGQPRSFFGVSLEDCASMRRSDNWRWHDYFCHWASYHYNYICQFPLEAQTTPARSTFLRSSTTLETRTEIAPTYALVVNRGKQKRGKLEKLERESLTYEMVQPALEGSHGTASEHFAEEEERDILSGSFIIGIVVGAACFLLLVMFAVVLFYRQWLHKRKAEKEPTVLFENRSYSQINQTEITAPASARQRPTYLNTNEVNALYEEVSKVVNHGMNAYTAYVPPEACVSMQVCSPLLITAADSAEKQHNKRPANLVNNQIYTVESTKNTNENIYEDMEAVSK